MFFLAKYVKKEVMFSDNMMVEEAKLCCKLVIVLSNHSAKLSWYSLLITTLFYGSTHVLFFLAPKRLPFHDQTV